MSDLRWAIVIPKGDGHDFPIFYSNDYDEGMTDRPEKICWFETWEKAERLLYEFLWPAWEFKPQSALILRRDWFDNWMVERAISE